MKSHGVSMKCHQCHEVRPCRMTVDVAPAADKKGNVAADAPMVQILVYLCGPCRKELGR